MRYDINRYSFKKFAGIKKIKNQVCYFRDLLSAPNQKFYPHEIPIIYSTGL